MRTFNRISVISDKFYCEKFFFDSKKFFKIFIVSLYRAANNQINILKAPPHAEIQRFCTTDNFKEAPALRLIKVCAREFKKSNNTRLTISSANYFDLADFLRWLIKR